MPGLGTSLGRGGATTAQQDLANADAILIMGSSMAENHPVGFRWVLKARERGATILHVDPRFSTHVRVWPTCGCRSARVPTSCFSARSSTTSSPTLWSFASTSVPYTNAATIVSDDFRDMEDLGGFFSGWDPATRSYSNESWAYATDPARLTANRGATRRCSIHGASFKFFRAISRAIRLLWLKTSAAFPRMRSFAVAEAFCRASGTERTGAICYAVGWTQHSTGVQIS